MTRLISSFLLFLTLIVSGLASPTLAQDKPASTSDASMESPQPIRFDRNHSTLGFNVPIVKGLSKVTGKFTDFSVDLIWDPANLDSSSVTIKIQVESIDTGIENRNKHLKTSDFFDVELYPTIDFVGHSIRREGDGYMVDGTFTMHGVSKDITIPMTTQEFTSEAGDSWTAFRVNYVLDRTDYGMNWKHSSVDFFVGDNIETDIVLLTR